jgi:hypothetical protein
MRFIGISEAHQPADDFGLSFHIVLGESEPIPTPSLVIVEGLNARVFNFSRSDRQSLEVLNQVLTSFSRAEFHGIERLTVSPKTDTPFIISHVQSMI